MNASAPHQLDEITTLEKATVLGRSFIYHYVTEANDADKEMCAGLEG